MRAQGHLLKMSLGGMRSLSVMDSRTIDEIACKYQHILNYVWPLRRRLQDTVSLVPTQNERLICLGIVLNCLLSLLLPYLIYSFDRLEVIIGYGTRSYSSLPRYWPGTNVVLQGTEIGRRVE